MSQNKIRMDYEIARRAVDLIAAIEGTPDARTSVVQVLRVELAYDGDLCDAAVVWSEDDGGYVIEVSR